MTNRFQIYSFLCTLSTSLFRALDHFARFATLPQADASVLAHASAKDGIHRPEEGYQDLVPDAECLNKVS